MKSSRLIVYFKRMLKHLRGLIKFIRSLFPTYTYSKMRKKIVMLEESENDADYPDELLNKRAWSFSYLDKLYEWSVNGARSSKAIAHLKKVMNKVYGLFAGVCLLIIIVLIWFAGSRK